MVFKNTEQINEDKTKKDKTSRISSRYNVSNSSRQWNISRNMDVPFPIKNISISNPLKTFSKPKAIKFTQRLKELTETNLDKVQISKKIMLE